MISTASFRCCSASSLSRIFTALSLITGFSLSAFAIPGDSRLGFAPRLVRGESDATPDPVMGLDADEKHEKQEIPGAIFAPLVLGDVFGDFDAS